MKFKEVKTYQSVKFMGKELSFFAPSSTGLQDIEMEAVDWGIRIKTSKDCAIVSFNNIAYAKEADVAKKPEDKKPVKAS